MRLRGIYEGCSVGRREKPSILRWIRSHNAPPLKREHWLLRHPDKNFKGISYKKSVNFSGLRHFIEPLSEKIVIKIPTSSKRSRKKFLWSRQFVWCYKGISARVCVRDTRTGCGRQCIILLYRFTVRLYFTGAGHPYLSVSYFWS